MKKKIIIIALAAVIGAAVILSFVISPKSTGELLSPAVSVICSETSMIKSELRGKSIEFSLADFEKNLSVSNIKEITVTSLPSDGDGALTLGDVRILPGDTIDKKSISKMKFTFSGENVSETSFTFKCDSYLGGAEIKCLLYALDEDNKAPTVSEYSENELYTYKDISVFGNMISDDPENDEEEYFVVAFPENGKLELSGKLGSFKYTPTSGYVGKDGFSYVVRDSYGNYSDVMTVNITIAKSKIELEYNDMADSVAYSESIYLAENSVMLGTLEGGGMYFHPNETVSRGEFTVMLMKCAGFCDDMSEKETVYDDNSSIPASIRPYVARAQSLGCSIATFDGTSLLFSQDEEITNGEAAYMIASALGLDQSESFEISLSDFLPTWQKKAMASLNGKGLMLDVCEKVNEKMTRENAAKVLANLMRQNIK